MTTGAWVIQLCLLIGAGVGFALLLWWARAPGGRPGAAIGGGLIAGFLLGPAVLGAVRGDLYEAVFLGGQSQRIALERAQSRHDAELAAARHAGMSPEDVADLEARRFDERQRLEAELGAARATFEVPSKWMALVLSGAGLGLGLTAHRRRGGRETDPVRWGLVAAGLGVALLGCLVPALLMHWLADVPPRQALLVGGAAAGGSAFTGLPMRWIASGGRTVAARTLGAGALAGAGALIGATIGPGRVVWLGIPAIGVILGAIAGRTVRLGAVQRRLARAIVLWIVVPTLGAFVTSRISWGPIVADVRLWLLLAAWIVLAGDGQFLGAWLGLMTFGDQTPRAASVSLETIGLGFGPTRVCLAAVVVASGAIDTASGAGSACAAGLMLAALAPEIMLSTNRRMIRQLERTPHA